MMNIMAFSLIFILIILLGILALGLWIWALIDCLRSDRDSMQKILWIIVIFLFNIVGAIIYLMLRQSDISRNDSTRRGGAKKLTRSREDRVIAGVLGGLGEYLEVDPTVIRLVFVIITIFSVGTAFLFYIAAAIIIPSKGSIDQKNPRRGLFLILIAVFSILIVLVLALSSGLFSYSSGHSVSKQVIVQANDPIRNARAIANNAVADTIEYRNSNGSGIMVHLIETIDEDICQKRNNDPFSMGMQRPCYRVYLSFFVEDERIEKYEAEVIVIDEKAEKVSLKEVLKYKNLIKITTVDDCRESGYEVLYPDCMDCPPQCDTPVGIFDLEEGCIDMCGDGICQEMVCMGAGCPCAEDSLRCPADCR